MNQPQSEAFIDEMIGTALSSPDLPDSNVAEAGLAPTVLVVEDDADIAMSLQIRLGIQGYQSCLASDATSALAVALDHDPACAILDVNMPGGDGFSVATRLRSELGDPNIPVIFLTASMRPGLRERAENFGNSAFVAKPYKAAELMLMIGSMIDGSDRT